MLDLEIATYMHGGCFKRTIKTLELVSLELKESLKTLNNSIENDLRLCFCIVYGLKLSFNNIGAFELSNKAKALESALKLDDVDYFKKIYPSFKSECLLLLNIISPIIKLQGNIDKPCGSIDYVIKAIMDFEKALKLYERTDAIKVFKYVSIFDYGYEINNVLLEINTLFLLYEYKNIPKKIEELRMLCLKEKDKI